MSKRYRDKRERYVMLGLWLLNSPAWQSLPPAARALYIEMVKRLQRFEQRPNRHCGPRRCQVYCRQQRHRSRPPLGGNPPSAAASGIVYLPCTYCPYLHALMDPDARALISMPGNTAIEWIQHS
jgi:hypothetical protein